MTTMVSRGRQKKIDLIEKVCKDYSGPANWIFLIDYKGLKAQKDVGLRIGIKKSGAKMMVIKNSLNAIAMKNTGFLGMDDFYKGQLASVCTSDVVSTAKVINAYNISGDIRLVAYSDGSRVYSPESILELANLPSLDVLQSSLLSVLLGTSTRLVRTLSEPASMLVRVCNAKAKNIQ